MKEGKEKLTDAQAGLHNRPHPPLVRALERTLTLAAARLEVVWRSALWRSLVRRSWVCRSWVGRSWGCRAGTKRKALSVRETAALGDPRFVSVIQFHRHRLLTSSRPSPLPLLPQFPDTPP